jgi:hypothetical protein
MTNFNDLNILQNAGSEVVELMQRHLSPFLGKRTQHTTSDPRPFEKSVVTIDALQIEVISSNGRRKSRWDSVPPLGRPFWVDMKEEEVGEILQVEVAQTFRLYPLEVMVPCIGRSRPVVKWAVDVLVDDSDPSVGMYGEAQVEHSVHRNLYEAIIEVGKLGLEFQLQNSFSLDAERDELDELSQSLGV